jgi:3-deoxy-manno-octulosonate cytidylyltransferase (CMP-KDO synthetase)
MIASAIIPARMGSTRFPGKPLADLAGKPIIQWVYERASQAGSLSSVVVATCDREIADAVTAFGGLVVMTSDTHRSGTDRIAEAAREVEADIIVNVQGDEPLIDPASIDLAVEPLLSDDGAVMSSLMVPIDRDSAADPNLVKVVVDVEGFALYFSRSPIPYERNPLESKSIYGHVGLYAYRKDFLLKFASLDPTPLEMAESLEQLRALEHGFRIKMVEVTERPLGVDTPEDLERAREVLLNVNG